MGEDADLEKATFCFLKVWQSLWPFRLLYFCPLATASPGLFLFPFSLTLILPQSFLFS